MENRTFLSIMIHPLPQPLKIFCRIIKMFRPFIKIFRPFILIKRHFIQPLSINNLHASKPLYSPSLSSPLKIPNRENRTFFLFLFSLFSPPLSLFPSPHFPLLFFKHPSHFPLFPQPHPLYIHPSL